MTGKAIFCILICAFCCSFQFGWSIGVLNTPGDVIKQFMNTSYQQSHNGTLIPDTVLTDLWSLANGIYVFFGYFILNCVL